MLLAVLALALIILDAKTDLLKPLREQFTGLSAPLYWVTSLPERIGEWGDDNLTSREDLLAENAALRSENYVLKQKLQKMAALTAENAHLNELLNSSEIVDEDVLIAKLIGVSPDPRRHEIVLDKGSNEGVFVGQAVLDADGLVGLVIETSPISSRVLLIVDSQNAVPVQVLRNNVRAIAEGTGIIDRLHLRHVVATTDIVEGDMLVSSGLGRRYPAGYPVAKVYAVEANPGQAFLTIKARPLAQLNRSRHFLLVFSDDITESGNEAGEPGNE